LSAQAELQLKELEQAYTEALAAGDYAAMTKAGQRMTALSRDLNKQATVMSRHPDDPRVRGALERQKLAQKGGKELALRMMAMLAIGDDQELRHSSRRWANHLLWRYQPGQVWRGSFSGLAYELGLGERTGYRAKRELVERGHLEAVGGGLVVLMVETSIDYGVDLDATPEQFQAVLESLPPPAKVYVLRRRGTIT